MQYKLYKNHNPQAVVQCVNDAMKDGWRPQGGISISTCFRSGAIDSWTDFAQAIIKD
jgi:hypothetical protein